MELTKARRRSRKQIREDYLSGKPTPCHLVGWRREAFLARQKATVEGKKYYISFHPCARGHVGNRLTSTGECISCRPEVISRQKLGRREIRLKKEYGIDEADFQAIFNQQGGCCAICKTGGPGTFHVDHCHATGKVRGVLCSCCNQGLGLFKEAPLNLRNAMQYLEAHR